MGSKVQSTTTCCKTQHGFSPFDYDDNYYPPYCLQSTMVV